MATDTTGRTLPTSGQTGADNPDLEKFMSDNYDPYAQTIMGQYDASKKATSAAGASTAKSITDTGNYNLDYQSEMDKAEGTRALESGRGFVINPGSLKILQDQSTKRIRDLTTQMNDALSNNQTDVAKSLSDLAVKENEAITNARTTFLNQYFSGKQEQRSEQSFQTPEQKAVLDLSTAHPDAGISPTDTMASATDKVKNSRSYQNDIAQGTANIANANAQASAARASAGLTGAQATQQGIINGLLNGSSGSIDEAANQLILNQRDPKTGMTPDQLLAALDKLPGGAGGAVYNKVLQAAQSKGYSQAGASLSNEATLNNTRSLSSGGFGTFSTALTNLGGSFFGRAAGANNTSRSLNPKAPAGQDGTLYGFPGYHSDGTQWVKNK